MLANDIDPDNDALKIIAISQAPKGQVTLAGNKLNYRPNPMFVGKDQFTYRISDGSDHVAQAQVSITILPQNRPPLAQPDQFEIPENQTINLKVLANDSDPDHDSIKIVSFQGASHGQVTLTDDQFRYSPTTGFVGKDHFTYLISDNHEHTAEAKVTVTISPLPRNRPPIAQLDHITTSQGHPIICDVLANDTDPENEPLQIMSFTNALHGQVTVFQDKLHYQPNPKFIGKDFFIYMISDEQNHTAEAKVVITVSPSQRNRPPVAQFDQATTQQGSAILIDVLSNDFDPDNDSIQIISFSGASNGQVTLLENQNLRYTPYGQFVGNDHFNYVIEDSHGDSTEAKVTVTISGLSSLQRTDYSVIEYPDFVITRQNQSVDIEVFFNHFNHYQPKTIQIVSINNASNGEVTFLSKEKLQYRPHLDFVGTDQFTYLIDDNQGNNSEIKVTVQVE